MNEWLALSRGIDRLTERVAGATAWLALVMVLVGCFNAVARYLGRFAHESLTSNFYLEAQWYLFSALFLLAGAHALRQDRHVRVDVVYGRLSPRAQALIDTLGAVLFLLPFCGFILWLGWSWAVESWRIREVSSDPGGLPRYPIKALLLLAFGLLALQGISQLIKSVDRWLAAGRPGPPEPSG